MTREGALWGRTRFVLSLAAVASFAGIAQAQQRPTPAVASVGIPPPGASSCSGCHPVSASVDTPVQRLVGRNPNEIVAAMKAFRSGDKPATIMDRIAKGFTDDEIKAIAEWYGAQKE
ncbi:MAG TPA: cytochrome C [Xanthobacteraceae bacterium]|nr:cytochrome C [Xanthobacteraceae bacterium]